MRKQHPLAVAAGVTLVLAAHAVRATTPAEQAAVCTEAAERFRDQYGKAVSTEDPPVVLMFKHTFCPPDITVKQGGKIRFLNIDRRTSHSFWFKDAGQAESERYFSGEGTTMTMDLPPGTHTYLCGPHWEHQGMLGRVTIVP